jgi:hypothetical protein
MNPEVVGASYLIINKIQTTVDGGVRLTFDIDASEKETINNLMKVKLDGGVVFATFVINEQ